MHADRKRQVLAVLGAVISISVLGTTYSRGIQRLTAAQRIAEQHEAQITRLRQSLSSETGIAAERTRITRELQEVKKGFYERGEMNLFSFGALLRKRLASHGMTVIRYQVMELKGLNTAEFSVSGSIESLVAFLKEVSESEKTWRVSSLTLTMREGTSLAHVELRVGYEVDDL